MKRIVPILLIAIFLMVGCSSGAETETTTEKETSSPVETTTLAETTTLIETTTSVKTEATTVAETVAPSEAVESSAIQTSIANETVKSNVNEVVVYLFLNELLYSTDNPNADPDSLNLNGVKYGTPEFDQIMGDFNESCRLYEEEAVQKTADYFGISVDEVDEIYLKETVKSISQ